MSFPGENDVVEVVEARKSKEKRRRQKIAVGSSEMARAIGVIERHEHIRVSDRLYCSVLSRKRMMSGVLVQTKLRPKIARSAAPTERTIGADIQQFAGRENDIDFGHILRRFHFSRRHRSDVKQRPSVSFLYRKSPLYGSAHGDGFFDADDRLLLHSPVRLVFVFGVEPTVDVDFSSFRHCDAQRIGSRVELETGSVELERLAVDLPLFVFLQRFAKFLVESSTENVHIDGFRIDDDASL